MGWRTVIIEKPCRLSYRNAHMIVRGETDTEVYIQEIDSIVIETTQCVMSAVILQELINNKVNIIFCDSKHNPHSQLLSLYGCYNSSKKIAEQVSWSEENKELAVQILIRQKILNQSALLKKVGKIKESEMLVGYAKDIQQDDKTNREGFAAKVYFNALFGKEFIRETPCLINSALDYGYIVLLGCFNREVVANGYLTQFGVKHCNEFNPFNLSCDLIEPFRVIIDDFVFFNPPKEELDSQYKHSLVSVLQKKVLYEKEYYLTDVVGVFVRRMMSAIANGALGSVPQYEHI